MTAYFLPVLTVSYFDSLLLIRIIIAHTRFAADVEIGNSKWATKSFWQNRRKYDKNMIFPFHFFWRATEWKIKMKIALQAKYRQIHLVG